jgi:hypothetical protein
MPTPSRNLTVPTLVSALGESAGCYACHAHKGISPRNVIRGVVSPFSPLSMSIVSRSASVVSVGTVPSRGVRTAYDSLAWLYPIPMVPTGQIYPRGAR